MVSLRPDPRPTSRPHILEGKFAYLLRRGTRNRAGREDGLLRQAGERAARAGTAAGFAPCAQDGTFRVRGATIGMTPPRRPSRATRRLTTESTDLKGTQQFAHRHHAGSSWPSPQVARS